MKELVHPAFLIDRQGVSAARAAPPGSNIAPKATAVRRV
ncbi:hypothetical protein HD596_010198 [Nonomuraea jabiensis]|uniref:Uncharacterized protein n=1 Tax=Nonomuraea jabiensis TaxID=882448 RepID=A0A7W9GGP1_9ACTN|nr:hypothetical protein [Nonomuraea jabiensis]